MSKKLRPCLKCDKRILTTPEWRICSACKVLETAQGDQHHLTVKTLFNIPVNTRRGTEQ